MIWILKFSWFESAKLALDSIGQFQKSFKVFMILISNLSGFESVKHALDGTGQFQPKTV